MQFYKHQSQGMVNVNLVKVRLTENMSQLMLWDIRYLCLNIHEKGGYN